MGPSTESRCGEMASDMAIILVTVAQLVFLIFFHEYIAWFSSKPDGSVIRLSMLTDDYFTWLPFPIAASIIVILASIVMIVYHNYWFRQAAWVGFCLIGITVVVALLTIFPFDFSVLPNATAVEVVPKALAVFLILQATFYGIAAAVLFARLRKRMVGGSH